MEALRISYLSAGRTDIQFYIINMRSWHSRRAIHQLRRRVSFPVYQDTRRKNIINRLRGRKDDMFVYDRCGKQTYYVPYPLSVMRYGHTQRALNNTYYSNKCTCSHTRGLTEERMQGDQPRTYYPAKTRSAKSNASKKRKQRLRSRDPMIKRAITKAHGVSKKTKSTDMEDINKIYVKYPKQFISKPYQ